MGKDKRPPRRQAPQALTPEELARERWLPIPDWDGYEVSDMGRVRSWKRRVGGAGSGSRWEPDYLQPPRLKSPELVNGYHQVIFSDADTGVRKLKVSRLVLTVFVGPAPDGHAAAHGNGVRNDNRLSNLRWATYRENSQDMVGHGTVLRGADNPRAKLDASVVVVIRKAHAAGASIKSLARKYAVARRTIGRIVNRVTWPGVP
jgi:hypothetical protein